MKKILTMCLVLLLLLAVPAGSFGVEAEETLEEFFINEQRAPIYVDDAVRKAGYDETWLEFPFIVSSWSVEGFQKEYDDKSILAGNVYQPRMVDGKERMVLLFEGPFDDSSASYGLTFFLSQGKTLYRCNLKTLQKEVFYQGENNLSSLICTEEWGYFLDGNTLVFYHTPSNTLRKVDLSEVGGERHALGEVQIYQKTSRFLDVRVPNKIYKEAFAAAGVSDKNEMVKTPERFASWIRDTLGYADITTEVIEKSRIDFHNICSYWFCLYETVFFTYDLKTGVFYENETAIDSLVYKELLSELAENSGVPSATLSLEEFFAREYAVPYFSDEVEAFEKETFGEYIGDGIALFHADFIELFRKQYKDDTLQPGLHQILSVDGAKKAEPLLEGNFDGMCNYGFSVFLAEGSKLHRYDLKAKKSEVFYQIPGGAITNPVCGNDWVCFAEGSDSGQNLVFLHGPSGTLQKTPLPTDEVITLKFITNRVLEVSIRNRKYEEAFEAAGVTHRDQLVATPDRFKDWVQAEYGWSREDVDALRLSELSFATICQVATELDISYQKTYFVDLKTETRYATAEEVLSQFFQARWAEIGQALGETPSTGTDVGGENVGDVDTQSDASLSDNDPSKNVEAQDTLWLLLGVVGGVLVVICGGVLLLLLHVVLVIDFKYHCLICSINHCIEL